MSTYIYIIFSKIIHHDLRQFLYYCLKFSGEEELLIFKESLELVSLSLLF